ncbi:glycoside hydrolase family 3 N-terminal domain-containing protein [Paenibacillus sp. NPDC057967]|uniref:glycoside hydrolase family 3 protein n=1 Tax=Paenibacillus sp. NPDC057967 TaxID=3346293 RepID=UPI0036D859E5
MLEINIQDVINILNLMKWYLIGFGIILLIALILIIAVKKLSKHKKYMVRSQSGIAVFVAFVTIANLVCFGPMSTMLTLASGRGTISEEAGARAEALSEEIAAEGIVLLANENSLLPLESGSNINVFGWSSTNPVYGGTGSGALSGVHPTVSLLDGLTSAGFNLNTELTEFYTGYRDKRPVVGMFEQDWTLPEPPVANYSAEMINKAKAFSDTAVVVVSRIGGEGADIPTDMSKITYHNNSDSYGDFEDGEHYLELSRSERNLIDLVTSNFDKVVVVYNGANAFELGFTEEYKQIKSILWTPGAGQTGFNALGKVISGVVNPSGKTSDTFVYDLTSTPTYQNMGHFEFKNADEFKLESKYTSGLPTFVNYVEGIYVGYRFYETAAEEGLIDYDHTVLYPFGYGKSYTTFKQEMRGMQEDGQGNVTVEVTVTNTGTAAGKEVVELYYTPPYTNGGIEKAAVNLVAFDKTDLLEAGASQNILLSFKKEDIASYDTYGTGAWVLEKGDYRISLRSDSHTIIDEQTLTIDETIVYGEDNKRSSDHVAAVNQFDFAEGDIAYLSRQDNFANYKEAIAAPVSMNMSENAKANFKNDTNYNPADYNNDADVMPVTGADNGVKLVEMRGLSYDDEAWEPLLDQLTINEMVSLIAYGGYQTSAAKSVGKVATTDLDGPASINNNFTGIGSIGFPSAVLMSNSWNEDMAMAFGESIGEMAEDMGVSGWYAPAMNMHRSAFAGRNFEYYSEDGFLSGKMAANAVKGASKYGVYTYLKHFALNDQEINRFSMLTTWSNEQAIREIYLKPFEMAVKEGKSTAIMSAYNYIGSEWAGASSALLNTVLRDEWGFRGMVITDYFVGFGYMDADLFIRNGGDFSLIPYENGGNVVDDTESATSVLAMRQASKNILYTVVNSRAYSENALAQGMPAWKVAAIIINIVAACIFILMELLTFRKYRRISNKMIESQKTEDVLV